MRKSRKIILCLYPNCAETVYARGLCNRHYLAAHQLVKRKAITWEELERKGKAVKAKKRNRETDWFLNKK